MYSKKSGIVLFKSPVNVSICSYSCLSTREKRHTHQKFGTLDAVLSAENTKPKITRNSVQNRDLRWLKIRNVYGAYPVSAIQMMESSVIEKHPFDVADPISPSPFHWFIKMAHLFRKIFDMAQLN